MVEGKQNCGTVCQAVRQPLIWLQQLAITNRIERPRCNLGSLMITQSLSLSASLPNNNRAQSFSTSAMLTFEAVANFHSVPEAV